MHPHLHTNDNKQRCEEVMNALDECHARGFLYSAVGMCNEAKRQVNRCLRAERLERTAKHREQAKIERARIKKAFDEVDANT